MDVVDEVRLHGGVMRRSRLPRHGVIAALAAGRLVAPRRGVVALTALPDPVLEALARGGVLSCASAAHALGLELIDEPRTVHVTVPRGVRVPRSVGVVAHRRDVPVDGYSTTPARTAADCARCLPAREALVVVEAALRRGLAKDDILGQLWGRGSGTARSLVSRADARAGSGGETIARMALEDAQLRVEPQVLVAGVGWVDLLVEGRVVVEIDGFAYHSDVAQFAKDRRRDAALTSMGYLVLRFTWMDAVRDPEGIVTVVTQVLSGWSEQHFSPQSAVDLSGDLGLRGMDGHGSGHFEG